MGKSHLIEHFDTEWGNPQSYSQAVRAGSMIYICGQVGADPGGPDVSLENQVHEALRRLLAVVTLAGGSVDTLLKVNTYLANIDDFPTYDKIYRSMISASPKPARSTVEVGRFEPPLLIEIDAVALATE